MTREIAREVVEERPTTVFHIEDGGVWLSGMNANVGRLARRVRRRLDREGYHVGDVEDDEVARNSGLYIPVEEAEEVEESEFYTDEVRPDGGLPWDGAGSIRNEGRIHTETHRDPDEGFSLPIGIDPERLNTEGASTSPSTFEDREDGGGSLLSRIPLLGRWFR